VGIAWSVPDMVMPAIPVLEGIDMPSISSCLAAGRGSSS
jgi:hypothetical protein